VKLKALVYSDGSERSLSAALYAAGLKQGNPDLELTLITIADVPRGPHGLTREEETAGTSVLGRVPHEILEETKKIFDRRQMKVETVVGTGGAGSLAARITEFAEEGGYQLIIMGTRGPSDLKALVEGSLARSVVRTARCPVLLVKKLPAEILASLAG